MWVCDGIKLLSVVGRAFDPVVFLLWLWRQFYVHINAIGRIYEGNISKQHQHPKIAQTV